MKHLFVFCCFLISMVITLSNKGGRNEQSTGAPFEPSKFGCAECHSGGSFAPAVEVVLKDQNNQVVSQYISDQEYTIEMKISSTIGKPSYYGFQAVMVDKQSNQAGTFISLGDKVRKLTLYDKIYIMQLAPRPDGIFTAKWKPSTQDTATLYIAGLAANGNNNTSGDKTKTAAYTFTRSAISGTANEVTTPMSILQYNIFSDQLYFLDEVSDVKIYDMNGNQCYYKIGSNTSHLSSGIYIVSYVHNRKRYIAKCFKQ